MKVTKDATKTRAVLVGLTGARAQAESVEVGGVTFIRGRPRGQREVAFEECSRGAGAGGEH